MLKAKVTAPAFFWVISASVLGNFASGWAARRFGYRRAIAVFFGAYFVLMGLTFALPWSLGATYALFAGVGFCQGDAAPHDGGGFQLQHRSGLRRRGHGLLRHLRQARRFQFRVVVRLVPFPAGGHSGSLASACAGG